MDDVVEVLQHWGLNMGAVRQRVYRAATPRERERWHAIWLLASGWSAAQVAMALERDPHTIGGWLSTLRPAGPAGLSFEHSGGSPPPSAPRSKPS
jgi:transposase